MRWCSLHVILIGAVGALLGSSLPAAAVPTCPANSVCIDESVEGAAPTVTWTSSLIVGASVDPLSGSSEAWNIAVTASGGFIGPGGVITGHFGTPDVFMLTEPGTGTQSDVFEQSGATSLTPVQIGFFLSSDGETGAPLSFDTCAGTVSGATVGCAVEDGSFQLAFSGVTTSAGSFDVYLKSDLDPTSVPEPSSLLLSVTALFGLGLLRGTRTLRRQAMSL